MAWYPAAPINWKRSQAASRRALAVYNLGQLWTYQEWDQDIHSKRLAAVPWAHRNLLRAA